MKCDNMERGCQWMGTAGTIKKHLDVCQFTLVPCPKKCKQGNFITRRELQQHLDTQCPNRDYSCEHCDLKGTYATTLDHYGRCEKKIADTMLKLQENVVKLQNDNERKQPNYQRKIVID